VLDVTHDPHAALALRAYAMSCLKDYPLLADDVAKLACDLEERLRKQEKE
jgi:hypothetical protein